MLHMNKKDMSTNDFCKRIILMVMDYHRNAAMYTANFRILAIFEQELIYGSTFTAYKNANNV